MHLEVASFECSSMFDIRRSERSREFSCNVLQRSTRTFRRDDRLERNELRAAGVAVFVFGEPGKPYCAYVCATPPVYFERDR
jgi:hypothetical protein